MPPGKVEAEVRVTLVGCLHLLHPVLPDGLVSLGRSGVVNGSEQEILIDLSARMQRLDGLHSAPVQCSIAVTQPVVNREQILHREEEKGGNATSVPRGSPP